MYWHVGEMNWVDNIVRLWMCGMYLVAGRGKIGLVAWFQMYDPRTVIFPNTQGEWGLPRCERGW